MDGPFFGKNALVETDDFSRIQNLPRRNGYSAEELEALVEKLTAILRVERSPCGDAPVVKGLCSRCGSPVRLKPIQAQALYELGKCGGLFGLIRVGGGKTLLSLLAPFIMGAKRPLLLLPAALKQKTEDERIRLAKHWRVDRGLKLLSYEELGRVNGAELLTFGRHDLVLADEAHRLKNKKAGVTRRFIRSMRERPNTVFVPLSGTMLKGGTILTFGHLLKFALKNGAPIPLHDGELDEWAGALDENANMFTRPRPGPLLKLAKDEDKVAGDDLATARRAFRRRLLETPGVVSTAGDQVACSLYIRALPYKPNATTDQNFLTLRGDGSRDNPGWETPDGWPLSMAAEVWRVARELALGFHGVWDPRPPQDWLNARKEWAAFVRETLSRSRTLDTELQVANACARGELSDFEFRQWKEMREREPVYRINPKDVWHDTTALETCEAWLKKGPGIVWVEHVFFGDELERRTGVPYFREGGLDKRGRSLEALSNEIKAGRAKAGPLIASVHACATGFNLQPWARNLLTSCPSGAGTWEQLLGRTHRDGQEADQVEADVMVACVEHLDSWAKALAEARMSVDAMGDSQKILIADVTGFDEHVLTRGGGPRWSKQPMPKGDATLTCIAIDRRANDLAAMLGAP